jgi:hypothetical protein
VPFVRACITHFDTQPRDLEILVQELNLALSTAH